MPPPDSRPDAAPRFRHRRLPGRMPIFRLISRVSSILWLGDDHLLQTETVFFTEKFRRFSYADIQALTLRETARGLLYSVVLGVLAAGSGLLAWSVDDLTTRHVFLWLGAVWLALLLVNLFRGKTCRCQLQTAAGPHPLGSLNRVRPARKALRLITEKVEAAQTNEPGA